MVSPREAPRQRVRVVVVAGVALALGLACGVADPPTRCTPPLPDDRQTLVSYTQFDTDAPPKVYCVDWNVASRLDATATSPGRDESHAVSRGGVIPWTNLTYADAVTACGRAGKFLCTRRQLRSFLASSPEPFSRPEAWVRGLVPTSTAPVVEASAGFQWDEARGERPLPDARALAVWTSEGEVLGRIRGDEVSAVEPGAVAVAPADFRHPLLGFRCCIDARLQSAFEPLPRDPQRVRTEVDDVPIVGR